jgi:ADP-dependent NAD(P)H-hydrate dehydratase / NAD(P)H-hydrate epimerase
MKVSTVEEMRNLDRGAVEEYGIPDLLLMENAGDAVYEAVRLHYGIEGRRFVLLCGGGNNGGDGFVIARKLRSSGAEVVLFFFGKREKLSSSAGTNYDICKKSGIKIDESGDIDEIRRALGRCDAAVDALFGTGLTRNVEGDYAEAIRFLNESEKPVVSVDIPSGIGGNSGAVMGTAVRAAVTVTFGLPKLGNILYPGWEYSGKLYVTHISFPREHSGGEHLKYALNLPEPLPARDPEGHKGTFGDALFIAGAGTYFGAPLLSSRSFLRAGGGYSRLAAPLSVIRAIASANSEVVYVPLKETQGGAAAEENRNLLLETSAKSDAVVLGPGMSLEEEAQELVRELVPAIEKPLIIDGDGLTAVGRDTALCKNRTAPTVITPHPGEMARLAGVTVREILKDRFGAAAEAARQFNAVVVLKGARTLIAVPEGEIFVNMTGNSGMGTAGSGDVLVGAIAAFCARGLAPVQACRAGVYVHGAAGDIAAENTGPDGMVAGDLMEALPPAVREYRQSAGTNRFIEVL